MLTPPSYSSDDVTTTVVNSAYAASKLIQILAPVRPNAYDVQHTHCVWCEAMPHGKNSIQICIFTELTW